MIIQELNNIENEVTEYQLKQYIDPLFLFFKDKINDLYYNTHKSEARNDIAKKSFEEKMKIEILDALNRFFIKKRYQFSDRNIHSYLITVIDRLSKKVYWDLNLTAKRSAKLVCPACKFLNVKSFLVKNNNLYECLICENEIINDQKLIDNDISNKFNVEPKIKLRKCFQKHSKIGYGCLDCKKFIPDSLVYNEVIFCPYLDCCFVSNISELSRMAHPLSMEVQKKVLSLEMDADSAKKEKLIDEIKNSSMISNSSMEVNEEIRENIYLLKSIINKIYKKVETSNKISNIQRKQMCLAYLNILAEFPQEMVSYLIYRSHSYGIPIQSFIFQQYVLNINKIIPFNYFKNNKEQTICSVLDKDLNLFWGVSEFETEVNNKNIIPNKTKELYIGGNDMKNYGPCYFGEILNITDLSTNLSITDQVQHTTFSKIVMNKCVEPGTKVYVKHHRIPSHYELGSLVTLQRLRKIIVDNVKKQKDL